MIDICFSDSVAGILMQIKKDIHSDGVLPLDLHLNYAHINCSRIDYLLKNNLIKVCEEKVDTQGCCWPRTISKV